MRLEEWQRFIETQFLEEERAETPEPSAPVTPVTQAPPLLENLEQAALDIPDAPPFEAIAAPPAPAPIRDGEESVIPSFEQYLPPHRRQQHTVLPKPQVPIVSAQRDEPPPVRRAVKAKRVREVSPAPADFDFGCAELWANVPRHVQTLLALGRQDDEEVAQNSYKRPFAEKRRELIERILDPVLSLEDTARLLNVCPTTVRRYTNKGILNYYRKEPQNAAQKETATEKETRQRRFRLSDILAFLETQQAALDEDRQAPRARRSKRIPEETP